MKNSLLLLLCFSFLGCTTQKIADTENFTAQRKMASIDDCTVDSKESTDVSNYWDVQSGKLPDTTKLKDVCSIKVSDLHPTQFAVGMYEVKAKAHSYGKLSKNDLDDLQRENPEPIVIGPGGEFYIIDHHHFARALYEAGIKSTYGIILENWYKSNEVSFWNHMKDKNWVYLVDANGKTQTIDALTQVKKAKDLQDDPYRSLAGETRCKVAEKCKTGQWLKEPVPFIEFLWAEHFRKTDSVAKALKKFGDKDFDKVISAATDEVTRLNGKLPQDERNFRQ